MAKHILAIHGAYSSPFIFNYMKSQLPRTYKWQFFDYRKNPEGHMGPLIDQLQKCISDECHVIGHSMGGILALWLGENLAVKTITTIATPLDGLDVSIFQSMLTRSPYIKEMAHGSKFLKHIHNQPYCMPVQHLISTKGYNPFIYEESDGVVTMRSQRGWHTGEVHDIPANHAEIMMHDETIELVKDFIDINDDGL